MSLGVSELTTLSCLFFLVITGQHFFLSPLRCCLFGKPFPDHETTVLLLGHAISHDASLILFLHTSNHCPKLSCHFLCLLVDCLSLSRNYALQKRKLVCPVHYFIPKSQYSAWHIRYTLKHRSSKHHLALKTIWLKSEFFFLNQVSEYDVWHCYFLTFLDIPSIAIKHETHRKTA